MFLGVITLQQKARWRTYCIATQIKKEYAPAGLTDGQRGGVSSTRANP